VDRSGGDIVALSPRLFGLGAPSRVKLLTPPVRNVLLFEIGLARPYNLVTHVLFGDMAAQPTGWEVF